MKTRMIGKVVLLVLTVLVVLGGCNKNETTSKNLGPAGKLVQSFFKNWEFQHYAQMHTQTVHSRSEEIFIQRMRETPIKWQNLIILSEEPVGDDWNVTLSVEVTDITCTFAACVVNLKYPPLPDSKLPSFYMTPAFLGIQKFMTIQQTWKIINLDGQYFIDICAAGSKSKRHENIMNYVLDAGNLDFFPSSTLAISASAWLAMVIIDTDTPLKDVNDIMIKSRPLVDEATENLKEITNKFNSLSRQ